MGMERVWEDLRSEGPGLMPLLPSLGRFQNAVGVVGMPPEECWNDAAMMELELQLPEKNWDRVRERAREREQ